MVSSRAAGIRCNICTRSHQKTACSLVLCLTVLNRDGQTDGGVFLPTLPDRDLQDPSRQRVLARCGAHPVLLAFLLPMQALFIDNWRVLHGREAFTGYRQLCGCYLTRDDVLNTARLLGLQA